MICCHQSTSANLAEPRCIGLFRGLIRLPPRPQTNFRHNPGPWGVTRRPPDLSLHSNLFCCARTRRAGGTATPTSLPALAASSCEVNKSSQNRQKHKHKSWPPHSSNPSSSSRRAAPLSNGMCLTATPRAFRFPGHTLPCAATPASFGCLGESRSPMCVVCVCVWLPGWPARSSSHFLI